jgi:hypothetical protein
MLPPPPPRREARNHLKPAAAFRIPASTIQLRYLRAAAIGHLHTDKTVPHADRDRDRPARSRPAVPDTIAEQLAHQQARVIPARMPGTEHPDCERAGDPRPLRPPGKRHTLPNRCPGHQRTRPSPPAIPRGKPPGRRADRGMHARLSGARQAGTRDRRGPSVAARGSRRCTPTVLAAGRRPLCRVASRRWQTPGQLRTPGSVASTSPATASMSTAGMKDPLKARRRLAWCRHRVARPGRAPNGRNLAADADRIPLSWAARTGS